MLKFIYGVMGSSKTAHALITKYNYEKKGFKVAILKPTLDTRSKFVESRIGLKSKCKTFTKETNILEDETLNPFTYEDFKNKKCLVIVDEVQFCTKEQIEQLKRLSVHIDIFCYGLKSNFKTELFEASKRLIEIADELKELDFICECGKQAQVNALFYKNKLVTEGEEIHIGDKEYKALCYNCYLKYKKEIENNKK